jgi:hypothetical protein
MSSIINVKRVRVLLYRWLQGVGFAAFLTLLLVGAKLTHHLDWSWFWAFSPLWLSFAFTFVPLILGAAGVGFISFLAWLFGKPEPTNKSK